MQYEIIKTENVNEYKVITLDNENDCLFMSEDFIITTETDEMKISEAVLTELFILKPELQA